MRLSLFLQASGRSVGGSKRRGASDTNRKSVAISLTGRTTMFDLPRVGQRGLWRVHLCSAVRWRLGGRWVAGVWWEPSGGVAVVVWL